MAARRLSLIVGRPRALGACPRTLDTVSVSQSARRGHASPSSGIPSRSVCPAAQPEEATFDLHGPLEGKHAHLHRNPSMLVGVFSFQVRDQALRVLDLATGI